MTEAGGATRLGALTHRNFRLFFFGQGISLIGTWMQAVALGWLVLEITNSPFAVGLNQALRSLGVLVFTLYGGVVVDRVDKRRLIVWTQVLQMAEALAEMWHKRVRQELGIALADGPTMRELFACRYQGCRYSFGYPACPELEDEIKLFKLLEPERIGCGLTENYFITPEQSTSALIAHHPGEKYFNVE